MARATVGWIATAGSRKIRRRADDCAASTSTSPRVTEPSAYSEQTDACTLTGHASAASEHARRPVDGVEEVAAVSLHHRQQQVASGVSTEPRMFERGQTGEQHATRLHAELRASARRTKISPGGSTPSSSLTRPNCPACPNIVTTAST